jgi:pyruvate kinase
MLSEETAIGNYPTEAVRVLHRVALQAEPEIDHPEMLADSQSPSVPPVTGAISRAAVELAADIGAVAIVTTTSSGDTARLVARLRPATPVLAMTTSDVVTRQLNLSWGVIPAAAPESTVELGEAILAELVRHGFGGQGDRVVITAGLPLGFSDTTNVIRVEELD